MDEYSRRATIDGIREVQAEGNIDSDWVKSVLVRYDMLTAWALDIARVVWALRWPKSGYEPHFEINFSEEYRDGRRAISAGFYMHQANDSFDFPFEYLFMDYDQIQTAEDIRRDEEAAAAAAAQAKRADDQRSRDIAQLKRLLAQYPEIEERQRSHDSVDAFDFPEGLITT